MMVDCFNDIFFAIKIFILQCSGYRTGFTSGFAGNEGSLKGFSTPAEAFCTFA